MSQVYIPAELRRRVTEEGRARCGYCLTSQTIVAVPMHIEHIVPLAAGGQTVAENLWLACPLCNMDTKARKPRLSIQRLANAYRSFTRGLNDGTNISRGARMERRLLDERLWGGRP